MITPSPALLNPDGTISAAVLLTEAHRMARYERDLGRCPSVPAWLPLGDVAAYRAVRSVPRPGELSYAEYLAIALRWIWAEAKSRRWYAEWRRAA